MSEHRWREAAAAYALGALSAEEASGFEVHLEECAACRADVRAFRDVAGLLAEAAPSAVPAPGLRERVVREAGRVRPLHRAPRRGPLLPWLAAAAALLLAVGLGWGYLRSRGDRDALRVQLAQASDSIAQQQQVIATILAPDVATAALASKGQPPSARLFWNPARQRVVISVFHLPPAPAGRTYQLWAIARGQAPVSVGIFNTTPDGRLVAAMAVPSGLVFQVTAVTEEPAGGSPQPTQSPFLVGQLQRTD